MKKMSAKIVCDVNLCEGESEEGPFCCPWLDKKTQAGIQNPFYFCELFDIVLGPGPWRTLLCTRLEKKIKKRSDRY